MQHHNFKIEGARRTPLGIDLRIPDADGPHPSVVICHGFKGFKDWGFFPSLGEQFAEQGFASLTFNFTHNGIVENNFDFFELDLFKRNTYGLMLEDLACVRRFIAGELNPCDGSTVDRDWADRNKIFLLGHSMGGGVAVLGAHQEPEGILAVAGWNPVALCDRFTVQQKSELAANGYINVLNGRTKQVLKVGQSFFHDLEKNTDQRDIKGAAANLKCPLLVVQGTNDEAVSPDESRSLADAAPNSQLATIDNAGHTFNAAHPFEAKPQELDKAIEATLGFFKEKL